MPSTVEVADQPHSQKGESIHKTPETSRDVARKNEAELQEVHKQNNHIVRKGERVSQAISTREPPYKNQSSSREVGGICDPYAIHLLVYGYLRCTFMPSVVLHVVEFTLSCGFDSHTLPPRFSNLQTTKSLGNQFTARSAMRMTFEGACSISSVMTSP